MNSTGEGRFGEEEAYGAFPSPSGMDSFLGRDRSRSGPSEKFFIGTGELKVDEKEPCP